MRLSGRVAMDKPCQELYLKVSRSPDLLSYRFPCKPPRYLLSSRPPFQYTLLSTTMKFTTLLSTASAIAASQRAVRAATLGYIDPSTCVDPTGYTNCYNAATSAAQTCFAQNCHSGSCTDATSCTTNDSNNLCLPSCVCVAYAAWVNCAISSCWNQVRFLLHDERTSFES
jgi:hypothetical protein